MSDEYGAGGRRVRRSIAGTLGLVAVLAVMWLVTKWAMGHGPLVRGVAGTGIFVSAVVVLAWFDAFVEDVGGGTDGY